MLRQFYPCPLPRFWCVKTRLSRSQLPKPQDHKALSERKTDALIVAKCPGLRQEKPSPRPAHRRDSVSRCKGVGFVDVNLKILDRLLNHGSLDFPFAQQLVQRR